MQLPQETRDAILADVREGIRYDDIAAAHQVSKDTVSRIALNAGIRKNSQRPLLISNEQATEIIARYAKGESTTAIAGDFGVSAVTIQKTLRRAGVAARDASASKVRHSLRHDALDVLTPDAAYWCGFIFTDGTIVRQYERSPQVAVVLQKRDREHLVKLRDFLGSTHAITPIKPAKVIINEGMGTGAFRYSVRSRQIADRLLALGRYGPAVDPELAASRDFWRGCVDGDGTIGISTGIPQLKLIGSKWLLTAYADFLAPLAGRRSLNVRPARSIFVVSTSYLTAEKVVEWLYAGASTVLDRKAESAAAILAARDERLSAA